jgi:hypothetical protein
LFLGTKAENNADRDAKGRQARQRGERCGAAKVSAAQAAEIKRQRGAETIYQTAARFGISKSQVSNIQRGICWTELEVAA